MWLVKNGNGHFTGVNYYMPSGLLGGKQNKKKQIQNFKEKTTYILVSIKLILSFTFFKASGSCCSTNAEPISLYTLLPSCKILSSYANGREKFDE